MHRPPFLLAALCLLGAAIAQAAPPAPTAPAARLFDPVKAPERDFGPDWRAQVCALLPQPCEAESLLPVRARGEADPRRVVVLAEKPLARAELRRTDAGWMLVSLHDFTGYQHQTVETGTEGKLSLAAALYPLGEGRWAVAVLATESEFYSGGGARFDRADFVPLDAARGQAHAVHADLPFYCSRMIRACFSEKEYRNSPHCHDESTGSLRITYGPPARPGGDYAWSYTWLQSEWPAHRKASAATRTVRHFTDARWGDNVDVDFFCGGPQ